MEKNNFLKKIGIATAFAAGIGFASAQTTTGDIAQNSANGAALPLNGTVRVVDNKGTIKYLQAKNGITTLTNTTANVTTTTWQLGGVLTDNTYIANGTDAVFALDGLALQTGAASTDATSGSIHGTGTGWTVLVRNEVTGAVEKILASDLLKVQSGQQVYTATAGQSTYALTGVTLPTYQSVFVYRNGAKLVANLDYTVATDTVTLVPNTTAPNDWSVLAGDTIEVQFIK